MTTIGLLEFAVEFTYLARAESIEFPAIKPSFFSNRQTQAIVSLGTSKILRTRSSLSVRDLVTLAIITSPPEAQNFAETIALKVLLGDPLDYLSLPTKKKYNGKTKKKPNKNTSSNISPKSLLLSDVLDFLNLENSTETEEDLVNLRFIQDFESDLFDDIDYIQLSLEQKIDLAKKRLAYEIIGGRDGMLKHNISSWEDLLEHVSKMLLMQLNSFTKENLVQSGILDIIDEVLILTREESIVNNSQLLISTRKNLEEFEIEDLEKSIISNFNRKELSYTYDLFKLFESFIHRFLLPINEYSPKYQIILELLEKYLRQFFFYLDDVLNHPDLFADALSREKLEVLIDNSMKVDSILNNLAKCSEIDNMFRTNSCEILRDKYINEFSEISYRELIENPINNAEWYTQFEEKLGEKLKSTSFNNSTSIINDLAELKQQTPHSISEELNDKMQNEINNLLPKTKSKEELISTVDLAKKNNLSFSPSIVGEKGHEFQMSPQEIAQLIGDVYENLVEMIKTEKPSYESIKNLMNEASLTSNQFNNLIDLSIKHDCDGALASLISQDMGKVVPRIPNDDQGKDLLERALGASLGENLLHQWFLHADKLPPQMRKIIKTTAKQIMIDLAKKKANALIGSSEAGSLPEGSTRPYFIGDDPDAIDLEETIENILFLGKQPDEVTTDDFIVRKMVTGRRCVIFLVDISGSMDGLPIASASICTAMMLYAFARDELGVALFESNTHVICEIEKKIELDEIVDEILELKAFGGTMMNRALEWADKQFVKSTSADKMLIMVTDAYLGDFQQSAYILRKIADQNVSSILLVPKTMYGMGNIQGIVENCNSQIITIQDWKKFPQIVSDVLSRS